MNSQVNYIIQGFLLFLLLLIGVVIINKLSSSESGKQNSGVTGYKISQKSNVAISSSYKGKIPFMQKCAACHQIYKDMTGPALLGFETRGPWADREKLYAWIKNPSAFMKKNEYTKALKEKYGSMMTAFPDITNEEIDAIALYITKSDVDYLPTP